MKVLQINSVSGVGSTGRIVTDIDAKLRENGIESYIAYGREALADNEHTLRIGSKRDYYIHGGLARLFDRHALLGSGRATKRLVQQLRQIDPDVIHLHNLHGYYVNVRILFEYLKEAQKPVVWTLHDCWSFTGHCAHFSYVQCNRWIKGCYACPQKSNYPASDLLDNSRRNYQRKKELFTSLENMVIVTPSQWLANLVGKSYLAEYPIKVINNGIDTEVFKPVDGQVVRERYRLGQSFVILGVASNWSERKGFDYFIELSRRIDETCKIMLVGLNDKQMVNLPPMIIGIKRTSDINELAQVYSAADVFINFTLEDNFPTVNLEALACGTPVITFDAGGSPEALDDKCGYVARIGNIEDTRRLIDEVRSEGKNHYSKNCIRRVQEKFRKSYRFNEYTGLYKRLTNNVRNLSSE